MDNNNVQNGFQNGPINNGMVGQMNNGLQNAQMSGSAQPQPGAMKPLKPSMDPVKKKKIILGLSLGIGGVIIAIIAIILVSVLTKVDYGESYRVAKDLKPKISNINNNYDCEYVIDDVANTYTKEATYNEYIAGCAEVADGVDELVTQLGQTSGVKQDKDLKAQYDRFQEAINKVLPDETELEQRLEIYKIWHKYEVMRSALDMNKSTDAEIQNTAKVLMESGNEILAKYGEGWIEKTLALARACRAYSVAGLSDWRELNAARDHAQTEQKNWVAENKPDITEVGGLNFENTSKMYTEFTNLYDMITKHYEKNYDGSGDCTEFLGEVLCD